MTTVSPLEIAAVYTRKKLLLTQKWWVGRAGENFELEEPTGGLNLAFKRLPTGKPLVYRSAIVLRLAATSGEPVADLMARLMGALAEIDCSVPDLGFALGTPNAAHPSQSFPWLADGQGQFPNWLVGQRSPWEAGRLCCSPPHWLDWQFSSLGVMSWLAWAALLLRAPQTWPSPLQGSAQLCFDAQVVHAQCSQLLDQLGNTPFPLEDLVGERLWVPPAQRGAPTVFRWEGSSPLPHLEGAIKGEQQSCSPALALALEQWLVCLVDWVDALAIAPQRLPRLTQELVQQWWQVDRCWPSYRWLLAQPWVGGYPWPLLMHLTQRCLQIFLEDWASQSAPQAL